MSDINGIDAILIRDAYTPDESSDPVPPSTFLDSSVSAEAGLITYDFLDGNNDNELGDTDKDSSTLANRYSNSGDMVRYDGQTVAVRSIITAQIRIEYEDGGEGYLSTAHGVRLFALENGDLIVSPLDSMRNDSDLRPVAAWKSISIVKVSDDELGWTTISAQDNDFPVCFANGTLIKTASGACPVEALEPGENIWTREHGYQPLRWIGRQAMGDKKLSAHPKCRPIRIRAGALGRNLPARELIVSPQHRILLQSRIVTRIFESDAVLAPAKKLLELPGVEVAVDMTEIVYFHLLFDRHETILAEGIWTESLFLGPQARLALSAEQLEEIELIFPGLLDQEACMVPSHIFAGGRKIRAAVRRTIKNNIPLAAPVG